MSNLNIVANTIDCGNSGIIGSGLDHCKFDPENMSGGGVGLLQRRTAIPSDFTTTTVNDLIKAGKLIVLQDIFSVEDQGSEDQYDTTESGIEALATKGLFKYKIDFTNGFMFHKVLASLEGNRRWDMIKWDAAGNIILRKDAAGIYRGFTTSHVTAGRYTTRSGGTTGKQSLIIQCSSRSEKDVQLTYINADELEKDGFNMLDVRGVNELEVSLNPVTAGATTITGRIVSPFDGNLTYTALVIENLTVTGATATAASVANNGTLSITVSAVSLEDEIAVSLNGVVESSEGLLFKSNTDKVVVSA